MSSSAQPSAPPTPRPVRAAPGPRPRPRGCIGGKGCFYVLLFFAGCLFWWLVIPSPIDPEAYEPPEPPYLLGPMRENRALLEAEKIVDGGITGPEDVAVDAAGRVYGGLDDGRIIRVRPTAGGWSEPETFADTGGRPLGLHFGPDGRLWVADAHEGLLSVSPEGNVTVHTVEAEGEPFRFTDDLDIAADGTVYFSDASSRFTQQQYLYDLMEARPHGRLLAYDPATGETRVLLRDLYFANGVALSRDESFLLVNETYRYRIRRYWLQGPRAGQDEIFLDNLPGFPDGVASDRGGTFWAALYTVRNERLDERYHPRPWAKSLLAKLPRFLWPKPAPYGLVMAVDEEGRILRSLHDPTGEHVKTITSAQPEGEWLYLGNLAEDWLARVRIGGP